MGYYKRWVSPFGCILAVCGKQWLLYLPHPLLTTSVQLIWPGAIIVWQDIIHCVLM